MAHPVKSMACVAMSALLLVTAGRPAMAEDVIVDPDPIIIIEPTPTLQSIAIAGPAGLTLQAGDTFDFNATGTYSDNSTQPVNPAWSASCGVMDPVTGLYNATQEGSCTVTAALEGHTDSVTLTVLPPPPPSLQSLSIEEPASLAFELGETFDFDATGLFSDGNSGPVSPLWTATCGDIDAVTGLYNATQEGSCTVTAALEGFSDSVTLTVQAPPPPTLLAVHIVPPPSLHFQVGESFDFDAEGDYSDGVTRPVNPAWSASCGVIDAVTGLYNATQAGDCVITAQLEGRADSLTLTMEVPPPHLELQDATVTFQFEKHGPFHPELKKFLDWAGIAYDDQALQEALKDFGRPCLKDGPGQGPHAPWVHGPRDHQWFKWFWGRYVKYVKTWWDDKGKDKGKYKRDHRGRYGKYQGHRGGDKGKKDKHGKGSGKHGGHHDDDDAEEEQEEETPADNVHTLDLLPLVDASWLGGIQEFQLVLTCLPDARDEVVLHLVYQQPVLRAEDGAAVQLPVEVRFDPTVLNVDSRRQFLTAHLELPAGYDTQTISRITVGLTEIDGVAVEPPVLSSPQTFAFEDSDEDGLMELMLKFRFIRLKPHLTGTDSSQFTLEGYLSTGESFSTEYTQILVRSKGRKTVLEPEGKAQVKVDDGATKEDLPVTVHKEETPDADREDACVRKGLKAAGPGYDFGPEGTRFQKPVEITLPYDPAGLTPEQEDRLRIHYWNPARRDWEELKSRLDRDNLTVSASVSHFSHYRVLLVEEIAAIEPQQDPDNSGSSDPGFFLGQVYAFPNPADAPPTLHVEVGLADEVRIHVYDVSGKPVHEATLSGAPALIDGAYAYEYLWNTGDVAPGLYLYTVRAKRQGYNDLTASGKVAVLR